MPRANLIAAFADYLCVQRRIRIPFGAEHQHPGMLVEAEPLRRFAISANGQEAGEAGDTGFAPHHRCVAIFPRGQAATDYSEAAPAVPAAPGTLAEVSMPPGARPSPAGGLHAGFGPGLRARSG